MGSYKKQPFVTGSQSVHGITEILNRDSNQWNVVADYPFSSSISNYATTSTEESVYIIGGYPTTPIIAEYKNHQWYNAGQLKQSRSNSAAITFGSLTMVIGGSGASGQRFGTEIWELETIENRIIPPTLTSNHYRDAGVFLVQAGYCKKT